MVKFDHYTGPTLHDATVPLRRTWSNSGVQCSRLQLPLKLAWASLSLYAVTIQAVTIHKSQGLTLTVDIGKKEFCCGLTFVACSRVCHTFCLLRRSLSSGWLFSPAASVFMRGF